MTSSFGNWRKVKIAVRKLSPIGHQRFAKCQKFERLWLIIFSSQILAEWVRVLIRLSQIMTWDVWRRIKTRMWSNNNPGGGGSDHRTRSDKDRTYEVLHYPAHKTDHPAGGSNGNRSSDGNKNRYAADVPRYRVVEQVRLFNVVPIQGQQFVSLYWVPI